jgi:hypothetical protein
VPLLACPTAVRLSEWVAAARGFPVFGCGEFWLYSISTRRRFGQAFPFR